MNKRSRNLAAQGLPLALMLALAACGGGGDQAAAPQSARMLSAMKV